MHSELNFVYLSTFLYAICHNAHLATLPYIVSRLDAQGTVSFHDRAVRSKRRVPNRSMWQKQYGFLQSLFSVAQLLGGLVSGPFKDRYGAKVRPYSQFRMVGDC